MTNLDNSSDLNNLCLGIDFGTTNSCLSIWLNNKAIMITDLDDANTIPTVIEITDGKKIIGKEAYIRKDIFEKTNTNTNTKSTFLIYEIKKLLGKKFFWCSKHLKLYQIGNINLFFFFPPSNDPIPEVISRDFGIFFTGDEKKKMCCSSIEF